MQIHTDRFRPRVRWQATGGILAILFIMAGCDLITPNEDEGDRGPGKDPAFNRMAEYLVTISPDRVELLLEEGAPATISIPVTLPATCVGILLPDNCQAHNPNWRLSGMVTRWGKNSTITSPNLPSTAATIVFDTADLLQKLKDTNLHSSEGIVTPTVTAPNGLVVDSNYLGVVVRQKRLFPLRQVEPAD